LVVALGLLLSLLLALKLTLLALLLLLFYTVLLLFVKLLSGHVSVFFKCLLREQEVDLHDEICVFEVLLAMQADHVIERLRLLLLIDVEQNSQFVLAVLIHDWLHIDLLSVESLQVLHEHGFVLARVLLRRLALARAEHVDFEIEGRRLELDRLAEELWVALVVQSVVRVRVDVVLVELLVLLGGATTAAAVIVPTIVAVAAVVIAIASVVATVVVLAGATGTTIVVATLPIAVAAIFVAVAATPVATIVIVVLATLAVVA